MAVRKVHDILKASDEDIKGIMSDINEYKMLRDSGIYSEKYKAVLNEKIIEKEQAVRSKKQDTRRKIEGIVSGEVAKYEEMDTPKAGDLSDDARLLQTGIKLNTEEATRLLQKQENMNPTMRRLILQAYKEGNGLNDTQVMRNIQIDDRIYLGHQNEIAEAKSLLGDADIFLDRWVGTDRADIFLDKVFSESRAGDD